MKKALFLVSLFLALFAHAQTFTQMPSMGIPVISGYNSAVYDSIHHFTYLRGRHNGCGDPFENDDLSYSTTTNTHAEMFWSGGGAILNGNCQQPIVWPCPPASPGDRHSYHQKDFDSTRGFYWMAAGVEDSGKCVNGVIQPGITNYLDTWSFDPSSKTWTQHAAFPYPLTEGVLRYLPTTDKLYAFGGLSGGNAVNWMSVYDIQTNAWTPKITTTGSKPPGLDGPEMLWVPWLNKFLIYGGVLPGGVANSTVYLFDPATNAFSVPTVAGTLPPGEKFPRMYLDTLRQQIVLFTPSNAGLYTLDANFNWTQVTYSGPAPQLSNGLYNSLFATYDSDTDTGLFIGGACKCVVQLNFPPPQIVIVIPAQCTHATVDQPYSCSFSATGGRPPYRWSYTGTLPSGLALSSTGILSGTPTQIGKYGFFLIVTDSAGNQVSLPIGRT